MTRALHPYLLLLLALFTPGWMQGEKVADLPVPTTYVNDFAHVLSPQGSQALEDLCLQVHQKANAEIVVITVKSLDDGQSVEEFTVQLEEKWKIGKKGEDRSALLLLVLNPHKLRIEIGYGLEGILNDARVGAILDAAVPFARTGDYDAATLTAVQGLAKVIAADANVTLTPTIHHYRYQGDPQASTTLSGGRILLGIGAILLLVILVGTGHIGWAFVLLQMFMGGGGGGGGRDNDDSGGGFGGSGGGESGGGGASRDF